MGLPRDLPEGTRLVLHVGCGPLDPERPQQRLHELFLGPQWHEVRFDIDPAAQPDIVGTIVNMTPVEDESVDAVWSSHNLEHVYAHEAPQVLSEFRRVLRPGGETLVTMPDLQRVAELIAKDRLEEACYQSPGGGIAPLDIVYGHGASIALGNEFMAHRTGFTARSLTQRLRAAGFCDIKVERNPRDMALWAHARRPQ